MCEYVCVCVCKYVRCQLHRGVTRFAIVPSHISSCQTTTINPRTTPHTLILQWFNRLIMGFNTLAYSGNNHRCSASCRCLRTLTSCRLKVKSSCSRRIADWVEQAGCRSPHAGCPGTMSPRDRAFKTRLSCRCLRSSSSHNHARLASRRSFFWLRSVVIGEENPQYMENPFLPPALAKLDFVIQPIQHSLF